MGVVAHEPLLFAGHGGLLLVEYCSNTVTIVQFGMGFFIGSNCMVLGFEFAPGVVVFLQGNKIWKLHVCVNLIGRAGRFIG